MKRHYRKKDLGKEINIKVSSFDLLKVKESTFRLGLLLLAENLFRYKINESLGIFGWGHSRNPFSIEGLFKVILHDFAGT